MAQRGRRRKYRFKKEACPNTQCPLYGQTSKNNIVSNGTYQTQEGQIARRFRCKRCGASFCSRAGTIFYGLRSPEERVLMALKLLVKGMPLRGIAEVLEAKLDTVRHWLEIRCQALKCESSPLASLDNFWSEAISHFTFPDLLFTELQGILPNTSPPLPYR